MLLSPLQRGEDGVVGHRVRLVPRAKAENSGVDAHVVLRLWGYGGSLGRVRGIVGVHSRRTTKHQTQIPERLTRFVPETTKTHHSDC